jgi:DNA polymerase-3 subunit epsilon
MREVVLDTETTGFDPVSGDRLVEIGCLELWNHIPTGKNLQLYLNPERDMPEAALQIHGLSSEFLSDKPKFAEVVDKLLDFIGDAQLVIHNAEFDMKFINFELERVGKISIPMVRATDTVRMARLKFPGAPASLDALCKRFNIDNSARSLHGALLDAQLLAEVYIELLGGRQTGLILDAGPASADLDFSGSAARRKNTRPVRAPRPHAPTAEELEAHRTFIQTLNDPIWLK